MAERYVRAYIIALMLLVGLGGSALAVPGPWAGAYRFEEHADPNQDWVYDLNVSPSGAARLQVNGFQTGIDCWCDVEVKGNVANVLYRAAGPDNIGGTYIKGTVLFTLTRAANGQLLTRWAAMQPFVPATLNRAVAFEKR